jgi:hypothetical protein
MKRREYFTKKYRISKGQMRQEYLHGPTKIVVRVINFWGLAIYLVFFLFRKNTVFQILKGDSLSCRVDAPS